MPDFWQQLLVMRLLGAGHKNFEMIVREAIRHITPP